MYGLRRVNPEVDCSLSKWGDDIHLDREPESWPEPSSCLPEPAPAQETHQLPTRRKGSNRHGLRSQGWSLPWSSPGPRPAGIVNTFRASALGEIYVFLGSGGLTEQDCFPCDCQTTLCCAIGGLLCACSRDTLAISVNTGSLVVEHPGSLGSPP